MKKLIVSLCAIACGLGCGGSGGSGSTMSSFVSAYEPPGFDQNNPLVSVLDDGATYIVTSPSSRFQCFLNGVELQLNAPSESEASFLDGHYLWGVVSVSSGGETAVWDLTHSSNAPVLIPGIQIYAVRPDGEMAIGLNETTRRLELASDTGAITSFDVPSSAETFKPSALNQNDVAAGVSETGTTQFADVCDGHRNAVVLAGSAQQTANLYVNSIDSRGDVVGWIETFSGQTVLQKKSMFWNAKGQITYLAAADGYPVLYPLILASNGEIYGSSLTAYVGVFDSPTGSFVWQTPTAIPVDMKAETSVSPRQEFMAPLAVSPNSRYVLVSAPSGTSLLVVELAQRG